MHQQNPRAHLALQNLRKTYDAGPVVDDLSLTVGEGELVALLGPSGCGKTTTLRMIAGFERPTHGAVLLDDRDITDVPPHRRGIGIVSQHYALFPHMDVAGNVAFGLQMAGVPRPEQRERVDSALRRVRLGGFERRRIADLSGGQQQRVALARALVTEPTVLLLDEPLSNLDASLRETMREEIRAIQREAGITTLFVTHDQTEALTMADRIAIMREGRIEQVGTPKTIYERPANRFVAAFIGRATFLPAVVQASDGASARVTFGGHQITLPVRARPGQQVTLMIRPQRIRLTSANCGYPGVVAAITSLGDLVQFDVRIGDARVTIEHLSQRGTAPYAPGDAVGVTWSPEDCLVFDDDSLLIPAHPEPLVEGEALPFAGRP